MSYKDLMKKIDYTASNPACIDAKRVRVNSSRGYLYLYHIDFDKDRGFVWSGEVMVCGSGESIWVMPDENHSLRKWFYITIEKGKELDVAGHLNNRKNRECLDSVKNGCYQDLQPLFEDYFWDPLRASYNNAASDELIVQFIKELALGEAVSSYLQGLIAAYNDSFLRNKETLEKFSVSLGYSSSPQRYGICVGDENFQKAVDAQKRFLDIRFENNLAFLHKDFVGDETKCFLYKADSLQEGFRRVLKEFGWRMAPAKDYSSNFKGSFSKQVVKDFAKLYKTLADDFFTKEEQARIKTLEKAIFLGDKTARAAYDSLVGEIQGRHLPALDEIERLYRIFSEHKMDDDFMVRYQNYRTNNDGIPCMEKWIESARCNFRDWERERKSHLFAYAKKQEFERRIDRLLSVSTYVDKDGREREMTLLDRCGQIILKKAESIEEMKDAAWKKREYELLIKDVEALREFQYLIGVYGGNKAALLYGSEDAQRNALFGENSGYVSADRFFAKIEEALSPRDGLGTEERIDLQIKTDYILEDIGRKISRDDFNFKLESVLGKMNGAVIDRGLGKSLFGDRTAKEVFCAENGDIDIRKLAEARKSILHAIEEVLDVPAGYGKTSGEVKYTLDDSFIQAAKNDEGMKNFLYEKLLVIDDRILAAPSDGGAAYQTADSSGSGSFGEVSDFLSTDAYLDKLYAKINGGSPGTGSFGNTGYSDAGGGAWHDGTVENRGESRFSLQKILKIGLAVIIVLFLLRTCGRIF